MKGKENLIPMSERSKEEVREIGRKGGINSGKARAKKKRMRETIDTILQMALKPGTIVDIDEIDNAKALKGKNLTVEQGMIAKQVEKALKGDLQALTFLRDTSGQKPIEVIDLNASVNEKAQEIEDYVNKRTR